MWVETNNEVVNLFNYWLTKKGLVFILIHPTQLSQIIQVVKHPLRDVFSLTWNQFTYYVLK